MSNEIRIAGPPGTGKTTTLSGLISSTCKEYGSEGVLVSSFTKAAARELISRDLPLSDDQVGTLHALCYRALDRPKIVSKELLADWNAEHPYMAVSGAQADVDDPYYDFDGGAAKAGDQMMQECSRLRGLQVPFDQWPMTAQNFHEHWRDFKANTHTVDFTDLIDSCIQEHIDIPHRAKALFLDEVQDFSPLELSLARQWGASCDRFYLCGDDDQCLYRFKGATPDAFLSPELPKENVRVLRQSYRVPREVHRVASAWVEQLEVRMPKEYLPRDYQGSVDCTPILYKYLDPIYWDLKKWVEEGKTVAFLASCSFLIDPLKHQLRKWGLPFHNPYRRSRGDWNPLQGRSGTVSASDRLMAYRKIAIGGWWTYAELWKWAAMIDAEDVFTRGAKTTIRKMADQEETATQPVDTDNLEAWIPHAPNVAAIIQGNINWLQGHILSTYSKPIEYSCRVLEECGEQALKKTPQIVIGTIHSMKGGEADIVVLFPDLSPSGQCEWSQHGDPRDSVIRMFYVGMTRAKESLYWAQSSGRGITGYNL
jgi:hypothetical protein